MNVDVDLRPPGFTGPRGRTFEPLDINIGDTEFAQGDTAFAPPFLAGMRAISIGTSACSASPHRRVQPEALANTSLNHWAVMTRLAGTYFNPKTGWEVTGAAIYSINWENPATDYETGNILNLEGALTKNFGPLGVGVVSYAMIQTTPDSGSGARLGSFNTHIYGVARL